MSAGERSSPVVDLQSAGCPTVTPRYCCCGRSFATAACSSTWNRLPDDVTSLLTFCLRLKARSFLRLARTLFCGRLVIFRSGPCSFFPKSTLYRILNDLCFATVTYFLIFPFFVLLSVYLTTSELCLCYKQFWIWCNFNWIFLLVPLFSTRFGNCPRFV